MSFETISSPLDSSYRIPRCIKRVTTSKPAKAGLNPTALPWIAADEGVASASTCTWDEDASGDWQSCHSDSGYGSDTSSPCLTSPLNPAAQTPKCIECDQISKAAAAEDDPSSLKHRSRLHNDPKTGFFSTSPSRVYLRFDDQLDLLEEAHFLAKRIVWRHFRQHWPRLQLSYWPQSWREVRFGRTELSEEFNKYVPDVPGLCRGPSSKVRDAIENLSTLRNAACHPEHLPLADIEYRLQSAQEVAVLLQDESGAMELRGLRDRMQRLAWEALDEIETYEPLATQPGAKPWEYHHQKLFLSACTSLKSDRWCSAIKRAAKAWEEKLGGFAMIGDVGTDSPDYKARSEAAGKFLI